MSDFQLHCFAQSGNAYKVALMLELNSADWDPVFVDFFNGAARSEAYREINEMAEVPALRHGEQLLTQSGVILDYLADHFGTFGPGDAQERREVMRWILWDNHKLTSYIATVRFMMNFVPPEKRSKDVIAFLMGRAMAAMKVLEARLERQDWVALDRASIADLSCVGYLYFSDEFDVDMDDFPAISAWCDRIAALPRWRHPYDLMPGHPLPQ